MSNKYPNKIDEDLLFALILSADGHVINQQKLAMFHQLITKTLWLSEHSTSVAKLMFWCEQLDKRHYHLLELSTALNPALQDWLEQQFIPSFKIVTASLTQATPSMAQLIKNIAHLLHKVLSPLEKVNLLPLKETEIPHSRLVAASEVWLLKSSFEHQSSWLAQSVLRHEAQENDQLTSLQKVLCHQSNRKSHLNSSMTSANSTHRNDGNTTAQRQNTKTHELFYSLMGLWLKHNQRLSTSLKSHQKPKSITVIEVALWKKLWKVLTHYFKKV